MSTLTIDAADNGARAAFDDAFADLVRAWTVADDLRQQQASLGSRSSAAADLLRARSHALHARLRLETAA